MKKTIFALIVGLVVGGTVTWTFVPPRPGNAVPVKVIRVRTTWVSADPMMFGVEGEDWEFAGSAPQFTQFLGTFRGSGRGWSDESCVVPESSGEPLEMGVINVRLHPGLPGSLAPSGDFVVWIRCVGEPRKRFPIDDDLRISE